MATTTRSIGHPRGDEESAAGNLTSRARNAPALMNDISADLAALIDESRPTAADGLAAAAFALHARADDLSGAETVRRLACATADRLNIAAAYVRSHDARRMTVEIETFIKNNLGLALVAAAAFGFLLSRALMSS